jgi:hypothetical protein
LENYPKQLRNSAFFILHLYLYSKLVRNNTKSMLRIHIRLNLGYGYKLLFMWGCAGPDGKRASTGAGIRLDNLAPSRNHC